MIKKQPPIALLLKTNLSLPRLTAMDSARPLRRDCALPGRGPLEGLDVQSASDRDVDRFPFARLNTLLAPTDPPANLPLINMSVGEPQGAMPAFAPDRQRGDRRLEPLSAQPGLPELTEAMLRVADRRYRLPAGVRSQPPRPSGGAARKASTSSLDGGDAAARTAEAGRSRCPTRSTRPISAARVLSGAEPLLPSTRRSRTASCRTTTRSTWRPGSG